MNKDDKQHYTAEQLLLLETRFRANLINGIGGYKPAALIATRNDTGLTNVAIFNSIIHIGASPPLIGFLLRPTTVARHTYENIKQTQYYTINHVNISIVEQAHYTAAKHPQAMSEFDACKLQVEYLDDFAAPYVGESIIKLGVKYHSEVLVEANGTILLIGSIEHVYAPKSVIAENGNVNLNDAQSMVTTGLDTYSLPEFTAHYPYPRPENTPNFNL
jgi:flavin reductase (DIM6/NTAB) family NADH-FMN oxidoreductase RutF